MTRSRSIVKLSDVKCLLEEDRDLLRELVRQVLQESLEAEMAPAIGGPDGGNARILVWDTAAATTHAH